MIKHKQRTGEAAVILAAAVWGCIGIFSRPLSAAGFSSSQTVAIRAFITSAVMFAIILIKDRSLLKIKLRDLWMFFGTGILSFLFFNVCYMSSINENSLSVACILMYTSPIWVTSISVPVFKEKFTKIKGLSLTSCFVGCTLVCSSGMKLTGIGLVLGLMSGLGYALYSIFGKIASTHYNTLTVTFYTFLFASAGSVFICNPSELITLLSVPRNIFYSVGIAVFNTILPYLLYTYGLSRMHAGKAAVISMAEPIVAAIVGALYYGEALKIRSIVGIVTVIGGLVLLEHDKSN